MQATFRRWHRPARGNGDCCLGLMATTNHQWRPLQPEMVTLCDFRPHWLVAIGLEWSPLPHRLVAIGLRWSPLPHRLVAISGPSRSTAWNSIRYPSVSSCTGPARANRRRSDCRSFSPARSRSSAVTEENGTSSMDSTSMNAGPTAYRSPARNCGRLHSLKGERYLTGHERPTQFPAELHACTVPPPTPGAVSATRQRCGKGPRDGQTAQRETDVLSQHRARSSVRDAASVLPVS